MRTFQFFLSSIFLASSFFCFADSKQQLPPLLESAGGHSLGLGNSIAAVSGQGAVKHSPAMIALERNYNLSAGYDWPTVGRPFYHLGAVDAKTSKIAAGITYSSSQDDYLSWQDKTKDPLERYLDAPINFRGNGALAMAFETIALGLGIQYYDAYESESIEVQTDKRVKLKASSMSFGLAGLLTKQIRFALTLENFSNKNLENLAPRAVRAGLAYTLFAGQITTHIDYSQRQRVMQEKSPLLLGENLELIGQAGEEEGLTGPERMFVGSFSVLLQNMVRLLGAYGHEVSEGKRRFLSGGLALVSDSFSLSYVLRQPYLDLDKVHHGLNLSLQVAI